jgi:hypothetical protein
MKKLNSIVAIILTFLSIAAKGQTNQAKLVSRFLKLKFLKILNWRISLKLIPNQILLYIKMAYKFGKKTSYLRKVS